MIRGIGNDIIEIQRVKRACQSEAFLRYVYTVKEQECFRRLPASLAGNFAVKEAVAKVLGTGFRGFGPNSIEVLRDRLGKPYVRVLGNAKERAEELGITEFHVSITNTREYAVAFVVAEKEDRRDL